MTAGPPEWPSPDEFEKLVMGHQVDLGARQEAKRRLDALERDGVLQQVPERPGQALADFLASAPEVPEFEIPGLVPKRSRVIITGEEGAGKSTLGRFTGMMHGAGLHPFTGEPYEGGVSVVFDCENPVILHQMRLGELRESLPDDARRHADERLVTESQPGGIDLAAPYWQEYLLRMVDGWGASLLVIGPLYKLCASHKPMSEEFFTTVSEFLGRLCADHGCALWIEAHCRQPAAGQIGRDIFPYGNTGWRRWPETGMHLGRTGVLSSWRGERWGTDVSWPARLDRVPGSQVLWKASYGGASGLVAPGPAGAAAEAEKFRAIRAAIAENPAISLAKLRLATGDDGTWIRRAADAGAIIEHRAGKNSGKSNRYEVSAAWDAVATPVAGVFWPDGRHNFQRLYEIADHSAMGDLEG